MKRFEVREAKAQDCGAICRRLRFGHMRSAAMLGINAHLELSRRFRESAFRRSWICDGKLIGLGGIVGSYIAPHGLVWLALAEEATQYPLEMVREAKRQIAEIMEIKQALYTTVLADDPASQRFALFLGFNPIEGDQVASRCSDSSNGRRLMFREIDRTPDYRVPVGQGYGINMGYLRSGEF